ncbi:MAG: hypothetical protein EXR29_14920 [Betaproteobacteria bacterium]|nr:hypothetical protein [Betaproteobacteria bacterium]
MSRPIPSLAQLRRAVEISEQIATLQASLAAVLGEASSPAAVVTSPAAPKAVTSPAAPKAKAPKPAFSPEALARISAATKARWEKFRADKAAAANVKAAAKPIASPVAVKAGKKKGLTSEGRAKLAQAMKARWAARRKATTSVSKAKK